ncbi:uncharacterized protein RAG0_11946 [Rhynchosporium agropyri]|uniref:Uncharacterized protein n=1 Tax=Rhynchosporium agropyri TaxID=914238 RepID=A0A1E1L6M2_9HELO|nr:uncharacterized protein RAG0_11946 [Rhynchosporium agropyri]
MHTTEKMQETAPRGAEIRPDSDIANAQFSVKLIKMRREYGLQRSNVIERYLRCIYITSSSQAADMLLLGVCGTHSSGVIYPDFASKGDIPCIDGHVFLIHPLVADFFTVDNSDIYMTGVDISEGIYG